MSVFDEDSIALHRENRGKLKVESKVPVSNKHELSLAYTPGVAAVSRALAEDPSLMYELSGKGNMVAVVSDGSAVLGLGNVGHIASYPVMEGKSVLFKEFGGVEAFPIIVKTQDVDEIVELVCNIADGFGGINLEDIKAPQCFEIEKKLKERLKIPIFHDDQHGTAIVVLAGLINALKATGRGASVASGADLGAVRIVINGAGAAGMAIAKLLLDYGFKKIVLLDSRGAIWNGRTDNMNHMKQHMAKQTNCGDGQCEMRRGDLAEVMMGADVFIGVSKKDLVSPEMLKSMAKDPIVFAMANPDPEISEADAKAAGAAVVATGRSDSPNQLNNVLVFPGLFRGALDARIEQFTPDMFVRAAEALAGLVENPSPENIIPSPFHPQVAQVVAGAVNPS